MMRPRSAAASRCAAVWLALRLVAPTVDTAATASTTTNVKVKLAVARARRTLLTREASRDDISQGYREPPNRTSEPVCAHGAVSVPEAQAEIAPTCRRPLAQPKRVR
jgi:hypothetical protein